MALTITPVTRTVFGNLRVVIADITFDSSYPTGGEAVDLSQLGLTAIHFATFHIKSGYLYEYDHSANKIKVRLPTRSVVAHTHTENTAASYTQNATTGSAGAISASVAEEMANGANLSSLTVRAMIYGT